MLGEGLSSEDTGDGGKAMLVCGDLEDCEVKDPFLSGMTRDESLISNVKVATGQEKRAGRCLASRRYICKRHRMGNEC